MEQRGKLKVLVILQTLGDTGDSKRIDMLQKSGFEVEVVAFLRDHHSGRMPNCKVTPLGKLDHGRYIRRLFRFAKAVPVLRRVMRECNVVYASGQDVGVLAAFAGFLLKRPIVVEVADIRRVQVQHGLVGCLVRLADRFMVRSCDLMVVTSRSFIDGYYESWIKSSLPVVVVENKLEASVVDIAQQRQVNEGANKAIRIGYFGVLRCSWAWEVLEKVAMLGGDNVELVIAGYAVEPSDLEERCGKLSNAKFLGEFRSPDDLPRLYGEVDLVWGCYPAPDAVDLNWKWARTNRFYESCCFRTPMVCLAGSGDASEVARYDIGPLVEPVEVEEAARALLKIGSRELERWRASLLELPREVFTFSSEYDNLRDSIRALCYK